MPLNWKSKKGVEPHEAKPSKRKKAKQGLGIQRGVLPSTQRRTKGK